MLPLLVVLLRRLGTNVSVRVMRALAASYAALFAVLLVQALRGDALVAPSLTTMVLFCGWIIGTTVALLVTAPRRDTGLSPSAMTEAANATALVTWGVLILFQRRRWATDRVVPAAVALFAVAYVLVIGARWAGWLHYLAFDLLVGRWAALDAASRGISPWLVAPVLGLTFMFGPAGWLAYVLMRRLYSPAATQIT